jgi:hypothetical protein
MSSISTTQIGKVSHDDSEEYATIQKAIAREITSAH